MVFSPSLSRGLNHRDTRIATAEFFNRIKPEADLSSLCKLPHMTQSSPPDGS
jgi:hypothetical protein